MSMTDFSEVLSAAEQRAPATLDRLVLQRLVDESEELLESPILRPWALDLRRASTLANAAARVLARKICGAEVGLEMDTDVKVNSLGLNRKVDYLIPIFESALRVNCPCLSLDLLSIATRDPVATSYLQPFLFYKGFHAVALQRISHQLWLRSAGEDPHVHAIERLRSPSAEAYFGLAADRSKRAAAEELHRRLSGPEARYTALWIQCRSSEVFGADLHPGARIGKRIFMDHATGVVVGETSEIGDGSQILHGVTLGGTGKPTATLLRHPRIGAGVTIGAGASVLGDIAIGAGATIGSQAVVTKPVAAGATVIGLNKVLTAAQELSTKCPLGTNEGTWWAETTSGNRDDDSEFGFNCHGKQPHSTSRNFASLQ